MSEALDSAHGFRTLQRVDLGPMTPLCEIDRFRTRPQENPELRAGALPGVPPLQIRRATPISDRTGPPSHGRSPRDFLRLRRHFSDEVGATTGPDWADEFDADALIDQRRDFADDMYIE